LNGIALKDKAIKKLMHYLIGCGESGNLDNPRTNYTKQELLLHMDLINAVMVKIKPGFFSIFCKSYNCGMLAKYFLALKEDIPEELKLCHCDDEAVH
jgi:hypothetical protein